MNASPLLTLSEEQQERMAQLAQKRGYNTLEAYIQALINADAQQQGIAPLFNEPEIDIRDSIKRGLREAFRGEYVPLATLWTDEDDE